MMTHKAPPGVPVHRDDAGSSLESTWPSAAGGADGSGTELAMALAFREAAATVSAALLRRYGAHRLDRVEDAVQDAFVAAARSWPISGVPAQPIAWLMRVAQRRFLDRLRPERRLAHDDVALDSAEAPESVTADDPAPLADDQLRLLFMCCHPALTSESRVALTLKHAAQFSVEEIARLMRADVRAVAQRLVRAKRTLQDHRATFVLPSPAELSERLQDVLAVCYAMFAEGHLAGDGDDLLRPDLCVEALRLVSLLVGWPPTAQPESQALLSLLCLTAARLPARQDHAGLREQQVPLALQDRTRWNQPLIARGLRAFASAAEGGVYTRYHAEAEIALLHSTAMNWDTTDWPAIVRAYDRLLAVAPTDGARLSRWVAMAEAGLAHDALGEMQERSASQANSAEQWADWHATRALLMERTGNTSAAIASYQRALALPASTAVHRFWETELQRLVSHS